MILFYHPARRKPCLTFSQSWLGMGSWYSPISKPCFDADFIYSVLGPYQRRLTLALHLPLLKFSVLGLMSFDGELVFGGEKEAFIYLEIVLISVKGCADSSASSSCHYISIL